MTDGVRIHEVSLRDGLQNEPETFPTAAKLHLLDRHQRALGRTLPGRYLGWWKGQREHGARQSRSA